MRGVWTWVCLAATAAASCVTLDELLQAPERFSCRYNDTLQLDADVLCSACRRRCPDDDPDCVVILGADDCPVALPVVGSACDRAVAPRCAYEPYCGPAFLGASRTVCLFLGMAECTSDGWMVMMASAPSPTHPTCRRVRESYASQGCCDDPDGAFELGLL